jgi:hypothetical protein
MVTLVSSLKRIRHRVEEYIAARLVFVSAMFNVLFRLFHRLNPGEDPLKMSIVQFSLLKVATLAIRRTAHWSDHSQKGLSFKRFNAFSAPPPFTLGMIEEDRFIILDGSSKYLKLEIIRKSEGSISRLRASRKYKLLS